MIILFVIIVLQVNKTHKISEYFFKTKNYYKKIPSKLEIFVPIYLLSYIKVRLHIVYRVGLRTELNKKEQSNLGKTGRLWLEQSDSNYSLAGKDMKLTLPVFPLEVCPLMS